MNSRYNRASQRLSPLYVHFFAVFLFSFPSTSNPLFSTSGLFFEVIFFLSISVFFIWMMPMVSAALDFICGLFFVHN